MFGNIFNQKKTQDAGTPQTDTQQPSADQNQQAASQPPVDASTGQPPTPTDGTPPPVDQSGGQPGPGQPVDGQPVDGQQAPGEQPPGTDGAPAPTDDQNASGQPNAQGEQPAPGSPQTADASGLSHLDPRAAQALTHAQEETKRIKQQNIEPDQLLLGLLYDQQVYSTLSEMGADGGKISKEIQATEKMGVYQGQPVLSKISQEVFEQAYRDAKMRGANFVSPEDVLIVLFSPNYTTSQILQKYNLKKDALTEKFAKNPTNAYGEANYSGKIWR